jgi:signal transduction histidine kinase
MTVRTADLPLGLAPTRPAPGRHTGRPAYGYLVVGAALTALYYLVSGDAREIAYQGTAIGTTGFIVLGIRWYRPSPSLPWWLLAGGMFLWFVGDVLWTWYPYLSGSELPTPSVADLSYFLGYPLLMASMVSIVRSRRAALRRSGWIDAAIVTVVGGLLLWEFAVGDYLAGGVDLPGLVNVSYPIMDAILIGLLARLLFAPGPRTPAYAFLVGAIGLTLVCDIAYARVFVTDSWGIYEALNAGWMFGYVLFGAAALHPSMVTIADADADRQELPLSRRRTVALAIVAALPIAVFLVHERLGIDDPAFGVGAVMLGVLAMVFYRLSSLIGSVERQAVELSELHRDRGLVLDEITRAIEEERTRLAAELHDGPIQRVAGLGMRAYIGLRKLRAGDQGTAATILQEIEDGLGGEVRSLRATMMQLRPPVLSERGLVDALRDHADAIASERGIVTVVDGSVEGRLPPEVETGLYRIAQEALMNVVRHASAARVDVRVDRFDHHVRLQVRDDGLGFDASAKLGHDGGRHFGLLAMRERAAMLHGTLTVRSTPGAGTTVLAEIPVDPA